MASKKQKTWRFVVRKYVIARDIKEALKLEPKAPVHEVWISGDQDKDNQTTTAAIGFEYQAEEED